MKTQVEWKLVKFKKLTRAAALESIGRVLIDNSARLEGAVTDLCRKILAKLENRD